MGSAESRPAAEVASLPAAEAATSEQPEQRALPPPAASLEALPSELLVAICSRLELQCLSSLACASRELRENLPDSSWELHLERLVAAGNGAEEDVGPASRRITNSIERQRAIQAASEAAEAAAFATALNGLLGSTSCCRVRVGALRSLVCNLCRVAPSGAMYFPCLQRGICRACVRTQPSVADSWRYQQSSLEQAALARRDAAIGSQLAELLAPVLPSPLREVPPRLIFSSESDGGSLATMLRCAHVHRSRASVIVVSKLQEETEEADVEVEAVAGNSSIGDGSLSDRASRPTPKLNPVPPTILSPLALRDIGRQSRRVHSSRTPARVFGAYCPAVWPRTPNERRNATFGDATTTLFSLSPSRKLYPAGGGHAQYFACDGERGISIGGDRELPAVSIAPDLSSGRCLPCLTFGNTAQLAASTDPFRIGLVQLWDLTPPDDEEDEAAAGTAAIRQSSVLTARRADAMMLPFRTSMMLRVE